MRSLLVGAVCAAALFAAPAFAQVEVHVHLATPVVTFEAPPQLVVIEPGVQVVPDYDREIFFVNGFYWCREGDHWFRSRDHRGHWVVVKRREVPERLVRYKPGRFRHYHHDHHREVVVVKETRVRHEEHERDRDRGHGNKHDHGHDRGRGHGRH